MTISKYIAEFIQLYENIKINTNHLEDGSGKYGVFRSPARTVNRRIDGGEVITESYTLFASQYSISESDRTEDDEWLEDLMYWVDDYEIKYDYPEIDKGRTVTNISVTGSPYSYSDNDEGIIYQLTIQITYEREVTDYE